MTEKKIFKGSSTVIWEDLTGARVHLLNKAIDKVYLKHAWTENRKICKNVKYTVGFVKSKNDFSILFVYLCIINFCNFVISSFES